MQLKETIHISEKKEIRLRGGQALESETSTLRAGILEEK